MLSRKCLFSVAICPTMFGTVHVVLPSRFTGAKLDISYASQMKSLNLAHQSGLSTSFVGSYVGVVHRLASVESGCRLSLLYRLTQPLSVTLPSLPEMAGVKHGLRDVLRSWKQDSTPETPVALGCLFQHKYHTTQSFRAKSLNGADELLLSHIRPVARELGFRLYLAHLSFRLSGEVSIPTRERDIYHSHGRYGRYGGWGGYNSWDDEDEEEETDFDIDDLEMEEETESLMITKIFDLDGMPTNISGLGLDPADIVGGDIRDQARDDSELDRDYEVSKFFHDHRVSQSECRCRVVVL